VYFEDGGYAVWRRGSVMAMLRCPREFRHRPSQCDILHFDLWCGGRNLLRDAGSYSYNCEEPWLSYFGSSSAHNTIRFDDRDPMRKLSRFLYGDWPRGDVQIEGRESALLSRLPGMFHGRIVEPTESGFTVIDNIGGRFKQAVLRWRLDPDQTWDIEGNGCRSEALELRIRTVPEGLTATSQLAEGWESLYYLQKSPLPVFDYPGRTGLPATPHRDRAPQPIASRSVRNERPDQLPVSFSEVHGTLIFANLR